MSIEISGQPTVVDGPAFAVASLRVPLNETPEKGWLGHLARQKELPGKAYSVDGATLVFHLDRDSRDIQGAMNALAKAIEAADNSFGAAVEKEEQTANRREEEAGARAARINEKLADWWEKRSTK